MKIELNTVVAIAYELSVSENNQNQRHVESATKEQPMEILFGMSGLPEMFERNIEGMQQGDAFDFTIPAAEGYGEYTMEAVVDFPIDVFADENGKFDDENVKTGNYLQMMDDDGHSHRGKVKAVGADTVVIDFNHPLSGLDMHFKGSILDVRKADPTEIAHGHVHGPDGHHH